MPTSLRGIANRAKRDRKARFRNLYGLLDAENLRWCFHQLKPSAAPGVDRVSFEQYEANLEDNLRDLVGRLRRKAYRAKLVRRRWIPKAEVRKSFFNLFLPSRCFRSNISPANEP